MPRGGKRLGAGRKRGSATKRTRAVADWAAQAGPTPLEVMLRAMHEHYDHECWDEAAAIARHCAPYMHPRLSAVEYERPELDLSKLTDAGLEQLLEIYRRAGDHSSGSDGDEAAAMPANAGRKSRGTRH